MAVSYRSVIQLDDHEDAVNVANQQFRSWLAEKARSASQTITTADWDGPGTFPIGPDSVLTVVEKPGEDGLARVLLELVETNRSGTWTTRLYALSAPKSRRLRQVIWFESEGRGPDGSSLEPGTPRVVRRTLQAVSARDGSVPVFSETRTIHVQEVEELAEFITDDQRTLSIVVASPIPGVPLDRWAAAVSNLARDSIGCASFFAVDTAAAAALNSRLGATHSVPPGAVRTYAPHVEIGDRADSRRHRILTAKTMSRELVAEPTGKIHFTNRLVKAIATSPRMHRLEADLPPELTRTMRVLQREQARPTNLPSPKCTVGAAEAGATRKPHAEFRPTWLEKLSTLVGRVVGREAVDEASLDAIAQRFEQQETIIRTTATTAERLQRERERLEDEVSDLRRQLEAEQFERALADSERRDAEKKVRSLEHWRNQRPDKYTYLEEPKSELESDPASVSEIIERLTDPEEFSELLRWVQLTDPERAIDNAAAVDAADPNGTYASAFWEYILVLRDYMIECVEHGFSGNVHMYLMASDTHGRKCPAQRHKTNESKHVHNNPKMRRERTFTVPTAVDPSGEVFMTTHFAPTHRDQNAPRMYYLADVSKTKVAHIGYMGPHLTNTKTN